MSGAGIEVRRLLPADEGSYRRIRLEALRLAPEAFGSTFEAESAELLSWFAARLAGAAVFGAFDGGDLLGIAGLFVKQGRKEAHKGVLWGMYVRPEARRAGIGRRLVEAVVDHARRHVELIQLTVVSANEPARRLYAKFDFVEYGIEKNALKHDGHYWDEILMAKPLLRDEATPVMIPRYSRPRMAAIWQPENYFRIQFEIEAYACEAQAKLGVIPESAARAVRERGAFEVERIREIEREVHHETIALLTNLAEHIGPEARFLHQGMTSSDVLDTCLAVQLKEAADLLLADLEALLAALKRRALEHKYTLTVGRSHGIHAEPTSFGLKLAGHYAEFARDRDRLAAARTEIATCAISGAVGTFANIDPAVEAYVAEQLGLAPEPISTQVIPRDRHAQYFATLALVAAGIERLATEIRHLQRTEVREAEEYFATGQKGSSAMPHKRNPVLAENLTGLARLVRSTVAPALENVALWHERDISHSSVERVIAPDATIALDFALARLTGLIDRLVVYPEQMRRNLESLGGLVDSQRVLLALTQAGMSREAAYAAVQRHAMAAWHGEGRFVELLKADPEIGRHLSPQAIDGLFDAAYHLKHVDTIFRRVFGE